jgi:hypothetical protein
MTKNFRITPSAVRLALLALAVAGTGGAIAATTNATATGTVVAPLQIAKSADLVFGNFAASASSGSVTITPAGARSVAGGVTAINGVATTKFDVTGQSGFGYSISLVGGTLSANGGANTMTFTPVGDLTASSITSSTLSASTLTGGAQSIFVGGVLSVGANQAAGDYAGIVTATVDYN